MTLLEETGDGSSSNALVVAANWLQSLLLGSIASEIAVIAVAVIGLLMLNGRIDIRRGVTTIFGCFLLFGAPAISAGLRGTSDDYGSPRSSSVDTPPAVAAPPPTTPKPAPPSTTYDPYAGASLPSRN